MWQVAPGSLLVLTVGEGPGTLGLRHARTLFTDLGSAFVQYLGYATSWTWAFIKGGRTIYEALTRGPSSVGTTEGLPSKVGNCTFNYSMYNHMTSGYLPEGILASPGFL